MMNVCRDCQDSSAPVDEQTGLCPECEIKSFVDLANGALEPDPPTEAELTAMARVDERVDLFKRAAERALQQATAEDQVTPVARRIVRPPKPS
jgi:hypothetical protein